MWIDEYAERNGLSVPAVRRQITKGTLKSELRQDKKSRRWRRFILLKEEAKKKYKKKPQKDKVSESKKKTAIKNLAKLESIDEGAFKELQREILQGVEPALIAIKITSLLKLSQRRSADEDTERKKLQNNMLALKIAQQMRSLVKVEDVEKTLREILTEVKMVFDALPNKIVRLIPESDVHLSKEDTEVIKIILRKVANNGVRELQNRFGSRDTK